MSNNRNERRANPNADTAGIPSPGNKTTDLSSPPFDAFRAAEAESNAQVMEAERNADTGPIEQRDGRGDGIENGKHVAMIPIHEIDALADEWAAGFAKEVVRTTSEADGDTLTVTLVTRHGTSKGTADVDNWTAAGVKKALATIRDKFDGKNRDDVDNPDKTLADAVRQAAKA